MLNFIKQNIRQTFQVMLQEVRMIEDFDKKKPKVMDFCSEY